MGLAYDPSVFDVSDMNQAMRIIMTAENSTTQERWQKETPYIADLVARKMSITADTLLLDYGCGIGRVTKKADGKLLVLNSFARVVPGVERKLFTAVSTWSASGSTTVSMWPVCCAPRSRRWMTARCPPLSPGLLPIGTFGLSLAPPMSKGSEARIA